MMLTRNFVFGYGDIILLLNEHACKSSREKCTWSPRVQEHSPPWNRFMEVKDSSVRRINASTMKFIPRA